MGRSVMSTSSSRIRWSNRSSGPENCSSSTMKPFWSWAVGGSAVMTRAGPRQRVPADDRPTQLQQRAGGPQERRQERGREPENQKQREHAELVELAVLQPPARRQEVVEHVAAVERRDRNQVEEREHQVEAH